MAALRPVRHHGKSKLLVYIRCKYGPFQGGSRHRRRQKQTLIESGKDAQGSAHLLGQPGGSQTAGRILHTFPFSGNIAADGRKPASRILDERPDHHIRSHLRRFRGFHKLPVAVVYHHENIRLDLLHKGNQFSDAGHG